jgi:hypothetical protein
MHEVDEYCKLVGEAYLFHRNISSFRHKEEWQIRKKMLAEGTFAWTGGEVTGFRDSNLCIVLSKLKLFHINYGIN